MEAAEAKAAALEALRDEMVVLRQELAAAINNNTQRRFKIFKRGRRQAWPIESIKCQIRA